MEVQDVDYVPRSFLFFFFLFFFFFFDAELALPYRHVQDTFVNRWKYFEKLIMCI